MRYKKSARERVIQRISALKNRFAASVYVLRTVIIAEGVPDGRAMRKYTGRPMFGSSLFESTQREKNQSVNKLKNRQDRVKAIAAQY